MPLLKPAREANVVVVLQYTHRPSRTASRSKNRASWAAIIRCGKTTVAKVFTVV